MARQLLSISGHYTNAATQRGLIVHFVQTEDFQLEPIASAITDALAIYDRGLISEGWTRDQAATFYLEQLDQWSVGYSEYHKMTDTEQMIALYNIHWLEQRGYLKSDDNNGMLFAYQS